MSDVDGRKLVSDEKRLLCGALSREAGQRERRRREALSAWGPGARHKGPWWVSGGEAPWKLSDFKHTYMQFLGHSLSETH